MRYLLLPLVLAGCNANLGPVGISVGGGGAKEIANASEYAPLDHSVPRGAKALLPPGVSDFDVRERDLCYAYLDGEGRLTEIKRADGSQYCLK